MNRPALVAHARDTIAKGSKSFGMASKLFAPEVRERAWLLYAWCRHCDDIVDGQDHGGPLQSVDDPHARLAHVRALTNQALAGEPTGNPHFDALGLVAAECTIPHQWPLDLVQGFAMDADGFSPETEDDLLRYCYHVAGVVGLMMACVMGVDSRDEDTLQRANDLGLAFQLANIARDVMEDAEGGRCYLPRAWLKETGVTEIRAPQSRPALAKLTQRLAAMAAPLEASARIGAARLPFRSRWAVLAAAGIYGDIAREVAKKGVDAFEARVSTSAIAKIGHVAKALKQSFKTV